MIKSILEKTLIVIWILIFWLSIFFFGATYIIFKGPSPAARDVAVVSLMETSAGKFVPRIYFDSGEIKYIMEQNSVKTTTDITDTQLVVTDTVKSKPNLGEISVTDVAGSTYKGKMMVINDPSRIYVASPASFESESGGMRVEEMVKRDSAVAGVNGGGFEDINGVGNGGKPLGMVIQNSQITFGKPETVGNVIGFDRENKLIVGRMSAGQALEKNIRDAVSFEPIGSLIVNGTPLDTKGLGGGLNPRTAIGQRADGAVLILVIDGRQAHSLGANYSDLIKIMQEWGAVNAANLDGGSSSLMVHDNKIITVCASLYGSRKIPTAILVR